MGRVKFERFLFNYRFQRLTVLFFYAQRKTHIRTRIIGGFCLVDYTDRFPLEWSNELTAETNRLKCFQFKNGLRKLTEFVFRSKRTKIIDFV